VGFFCLDQPGQDCYLPISLSNSWDDRCVSPYPACLLRWGLSNFFLWAGLNP
jgi:hypothetical protein